MDSYAFFPQGGGGSLANDSAPNLERVAGMTSTLVEHVASWRRGVTLAEVARPPGVSQRCKRRRARISR